MFPIQHRPSRFLESPCACADVRMQLDSLFEVPAFPSVAPSPSGDRRRVSSDRHGRTSVDSSVTGSPGYNRRSRPVSSVYDDRRQSQQSARHPAATDFTSSTDPNGGAIANDYKAYLPALSPVNDDHGDEYISLGGNRRRMAGESEGRHEDAADHNIERYNISTDGGNRAPAVPPHREPIGIATSGC